MAEGRGEFIEPGTGNLLMLQAAQAIQRAGRGLGVYGRGDAVCACAGTEIHQATTEAEQDGGQAGRNVGQGFGMGHINVPEIASRLGGDGDS